MDAFGQIMMQANIQAGWMYDLRQHSTCPHCHMRWCASATTERAYAKDFDGSVFCPECYEGSRTNPRIRGLLLSDGRRLPLLQKERGSR